MRTAALIAALALTAPLVRGAWIPEAGHFERVAAEAKASAVASHWTKVDSLRVRDAVSAPDSAFFISPTGGESGDGSRDNPWGNLNKITQVSQFNPGSTIYVATGTYRGPENCNVVISNSVNVLTLGLTTGYVVVDFSSCNGIGWQVLDKSGSMSVIIHGFTFQGGTSSSQTMGAALTIAQKEGGLPSSVSQVGISNCVFDNFSHGGAGGAVVVSTNYPTSVFTNCSFDRFTGRSVATTGALSYITQGGRGTPQPSNSYVHQSKFEHVGMAAAVKVTSTDSSTGFKLYLLESAFRQNAAQAVSVTNANNPDAVFVVNSTFQGNGGAAGAIESVNANVSIANSAIMDTVGTAVMYGENSVSVVYQTQFQYNKAARSSSAAGGLDVQGNSSVTVIKSLFNQCTGGSAGGVWVHGGNAPAPVYVLSSTFSKCSASNPAGSGGVFVGEPSSSALKSVGTASGSFFKCCEAAGHHDALGGTGLIESSCTVDNTGC